MREKRFASVSEFSTAIAMQPPDAFIGPKYIKNALAAGAPPLPTTLEECTALSRPIIGFKGYLNPEKYTI